MPSMQREQWAVSSSASDPDRPVLEFWQGTYLTGWIDCLLGAHGQPDSGPAVHQNVLRPKVVWCEPGMESKPCQESAHQAALPRVRLRAIWTASAAALPFCPALFPAQASQSRIWLKPWPPKWTMWTHVTRASP